MQNWDDLRLFLAVAREQSLSGAGQVLRLDPATLGRRMARLEKAMQARVVREIAAGLRADRGGRAVAGAGGRGRAGDARRGWGDAWRRASAERPDPDRARLMAARTFCCRRSAPPSGATTPIWTSRSWRCRGSLTCRGARRTWPSASARRPPGG